RLNPANHPTPEAYLEAARYRPLDSSFSYLTSRRANDAFFGESQFVGFGFTTQITAAGELVVLQVFPDSPASEGGLSRGDRIVTIDGRRVSELVERGGVDAALGADQPGIASTLVFRTRDGQQRRATLTKRVVTIPTVSLTRTFDVDGRRVGYVFFRNFVRPSYAALDEAFAALAEAGATELVLDLRYNGGGLVDVAVHLGGLVGGSLTEGQIFASFRHNDRNRALDEDLRFGSAPPQSLRLSRVVVI